MKLLKLLTMTFLLLSVQFLFPAISSASTIGNSQFMALIESQDEEIVCTDLNGNGAIDDGEPCSDDPEPVNTPDS